MFRCVELGRDLVNHLRHVGKRQPAQDGAVWAHWWCGRTLAGPKRARLRWVTSLDPCDLAHIGFVRG
jgi:hypothetical protein